MHGRGKRSQSLGLVIAGILAVAVAASAAGTGALRRAEQATVHARFTLRHVPPPDDVVVVGIDSATFQDLRHRWPLPRRWHATVIDRLRAAGARVIAYDVQFTEPSTMRDDLALYDAIGRAGGAVLATSEVDDAGRTNVLGGDANLARVGARAAAVGLVNGPDGAVTRFPFEADGLRSFAVVAAERAGARVRRSDFTGRGALIDYRGGPGTFPTLSFSDVRDGRFDPAVVRGKVVVVGATAPSLQDTHHTPVAGDALMAGPEVEANAIWTGLHGLPLRDAPWWAGVALVLLLGACAPLLRRRLRVLRTSLLAVGVGVGYAIGAHLAFGAGLVLPVMAPLVALSIGTVATILVSHLLESTVRRRIARENAALEQRVEDRTRELRETQLEILQRLGAAAEWRDQETGEHIERIGRMAERFALALGMSPMDAELLRHASSMHDVGKIGIPDRILLKPGLLDDDERRILEEHPQIGASILAGSSSPLLRLAEEIALTHHERWDGRGYPNGLRGEEIPLAGRICALCDVFDALVTKRVYKDAWTIEDAAAEIRRGSDRRFDPKLVEPFLRVAIALHAEVAAQPPALAPAPALWELRV